MPTLTIDGRTIAWREAGFGTPALLLHCGLAHSGAFAEIMRRLADLLAMRALDQPGHGGTAFDPALDQQDQAVANAAALAEGRAPAHIIGHSFGGTVALRLALEHPTRVRSLTLIEPVQFSLVAEADPESRSEAFTAHTAEAAALEALAGDLKSATARFLDRWGAAGGLAGLDPDRQRYMVDRMPLILDQNRALGRPEMARVRPEDLGRIACPVLLVEGAESPPVIHQILDAIAARVAQARRLRVAGAGHMVPITHPGPVSGALRDLLGAKDV